MKKMPCLFVREFHDKRSFTLTREVTPGCEWVLAGEGTASRKWDGTACMIRNGKLFKRYDAKKDPRTGQYKAPPVGAEPCDEPDPVTGHWPHWIPVGDEPESRWILAAFRATGEDFADGTYEACGPKIGGNAENMSTHLLIRHGAESCFPQRTFDGIADYLRTSCIEGIVFRHPDGRMCKIRRHDFGLHWGAQ